MKYFMLFFYFATTIVGAKCELPSSIKSLSKNISIEKIKSTDIRRNYKLLKNLCVNQISFQEENYNWKMLLVTHPKNPKGAFWFLPHDNENTAFDAGVYAVRKYGGGFLAVMADNSRYFKGQDPNRNFGDTKRVSKVCSKQKHPAPIYSKTVFKIINEYRKISYPYLALHSNSNGGGVSMLRSSKTVLSYPAVDAITKSSGGLKDEDTLVYTAGTAKKPNSSKLKDLLSMGLNTKYEIVDRTNNDCSMSNYVVLRVGTNDYYNIETQHGDLNTQKIMIDRLMRLIK